MEQLQLLPNKIVRNINGWVEYYRNGEIWQIVWTDGIIHHFKNNRIIKTTILGQQTIYF